MIPPNKDKQMPTETKPYTFEKIPAYFRERPQWVTWKHKTKLGGFAVELYDNRRFFTFTGWHWAGTPTTVEHRTSQLADIYRQLFETQPTGARVVKGTRGQTPTLTDAQVIEKCRAAKNAE